MCCFAAVGDNKCVFSCWVFLFFFRPNLQPPTCTEVSAQLLMASSERCMWPFGRANAWRRGSSEREGLRRLEQQSWPPAASVSTYWLSCDNSLQLASACGGWVAYTNTRGRLTFPSSASHRARSLLAGACSETPAEQPSRAWEYYSKVGVKPGTV